MCCHGLMSSTSDSRFTSIISSSKSHVFNFTTISSSSHQQSRISFKTNQNLSFYKPLSSIATKSSSFKTSATINDRFVVDSAADMAEMSFYELLGISESGSLVEIKQAYKQLARKYHPDVSPPGQCEEYTKKFIRVQEAYETLSDPSLRALYDRDMARNIHFAFSARKRFSDEGIENKDEWRNGWQTQLSELKRRSMDKGARVGKNMSWGARMRMQMNEALDEL